LNSRPVRVLKLDRALYAFGLVTVLYLGALMLLDWQKQVFSGSHALWGYLPLMAAVSFVTYLLRYARWHWLLSRAGHRTHMARGFLAYLSGFAFTATPGKVGELVRIRYLLPMGVPAWRTLAAFVYERALDLVVLMVLASLATRRLDVLGLVLGLVCLFLGVLGWMAYRPALMGRVVVLLRRLGARRLARIARTLRDGVRGCVFWIKPLDVLVSLVLGVMAWGLTALSFVLLLHQLDAGVPVLAGLSVYPMAMLAGAVSMIPGGLASTEATIVVLVTSYGASAATAALAAIGIRLATLWFAILCGLLAVALLERRWEPLTPV
jgi:uncharacterized protein (TIRG00374 family)